jgi:hypothetical protein
LLAVLARILEAKSLLLIYAKPPDPMVTVPLYPMEVALKPAKTNVYCYAALAVSIIIVWKVPTLLVTLIVLQPMSVTKNARGSNNSGKALKQCTCTIRNTSCTCSAKIVIQLDQYSFHLVCGVGDNNHRGHPPMAPNEITNCKRFLDVPTLENAAAMADANIRPSQAALFTWTGTGELFTRGQMASG